MSEIPETPFHDIESALEYIKLLLETAQEVKGQVEGDVLSAAGSEFERRRQGLQIVIHKLTQLTSHLSASRRILGDLRMLRRVLTSENSIAETVSVE
jgi:hypothetical protein